MDSKIILLLKNFIRDDKTEDAIIEFEKIVLDKDGDTSDTLILLQSQVKRLKEEHSKGIIQKEEFYRGTMTISSKVLDLINEFAKKNILSPFKRNENELIHDPISRQERIGYFAKQLYEKGEYGIIRQKAVLSSFAMPNREPTEFIWRERDELKQRESKHFESSYSERKWLENHAVKTYSKLIIQPSHVREMVQSRGKNAGLLRLKCLLEFLQSNKDRVDLVITNNIDKENLIIVGDWFYSHSFKPSDFGFEDTSFEWQKDLVKLQINDFDSEFAHHLKTKRLDIYDSKNEAISQIQDLIVELSKN